jgi:hypothetical protein
MILGQAQLSRRRPPRRELEASKHDPSRLSVMLRELSQEAHRLVRAIDARAREVGQSAGSERNSELDRDLHLVHADLVELQRSLRAQNLHHLAGYVAALKDSVEEYLA